MTPEEWDHCDDPQRMLGFVRASGRASDRKLRLFAVACCRQLWPLLPATDAGQQAVLVSERYADGLATRQDLMAARRGARSCELMSAGLDAYAAAEATARVAAAKARAFAWHAPRPPGKERVPGDVIGPARWAEAEQARAQAALLRCAVGSPFRPVSVDPAWLAWRGGAIVQLAAAAYEDRQLPSGTLDAARRAVLADMLEEAGCCDADLLGHLRGPGPHARGCWAVDLLLGRDLPTSSS